MRQKKVYVGAKDTASTEYRRQKSNRLGVQESIADPLLATVRFTLDLALSININILKAEQLE